MQQQLILSHLLKTKVSLSNYTSPGSPSLIQSVFFHLVPIEYSHGALREMLQGTIELTNHLETHLFVVNVRR